VSDDLEILFVGVDSVMVKTTATACATCCKPATGTPEAIKAVIFDTIMPLFSPRALLLANFSSLDFVLTFDLLLWSVGF